MNWNYELESFVTVNSAVPRDVAINLWAKSEMAYNCNGFYYTKNPDRFYPKCKPVKKRKPIAFQFYLANALRMLADKICPQPFPYA